MRINFHGAAHTVTGSQHLLEINGQKLLLDCGMYQGKRAESYDRNLNFHYDPRDVDAVILSHAHIDHSGNLPNLVKQGFEGPIFATNATKDIASVMVADSGRIQESDAEFVNKKRAQRGEEPIEPLYTEQDAEAVAGMFVGKSYEEVFEPIPGVQARFYEAGHILGSASVSLMIEEKGKKTHLWFSGDIGRYKLPLLRDPILPSHADYLIMESTYGDKKHNDPDLAFKEFEEVVKRTIHRGGKVIVPAFAVGRTQEIVYHLNQMMYERGVPRVPVYVDSPLAVKASDIFKNHLECFDDETRKFVAESRHPALDFDMLSYIRSVEESKALNERKDPMVIISASGMAETGRIVHHIRNNIENPRNTICIVSWQAPNTMGRRLADREPEIRIFGEAYKLKCEVATIGGLSGHAGQDLLVEYATSVKQSVKDVFLVHGEENQATTLTALLKERGMSRVHYPEMHDGVDVL
ncbi:MAG TPA: MBL fold metallo-hydrolase [Anaerolineales bacterium]|nr:MBL fold metallo-hydrolase [Anaerolineales bacterium]